jgi:small-conductance mechanosensitive channel
MTDSVSELLRDFAIKGLDAGASLLRIAVILAAAWGISWVARRQIEPMMSRRSFGRNGALLVGRVLSGAAFVGAFLVILGSFGANWTGLLAVLSAFTVAIGLSLQDVMKNFFAGIILLIERPFQIGDRVKVKEVEGEIQGIDIRTTLIRNTEGALVLVPNSLMFTEVLTNRSHYRTRRLELSIMVPTLQIEEIERRITPAIEDLEGVRKPIPPPMIRSFSPEGTQIEMSILIDAKSGAEHLIVRALIGELDGSKIEVMK